MVTFCIFHLLKKYLSDTNLNLNTKTDIILFITDFHFKNIKSGI
jgi:hypothetical protein